MILRKSNHLTQQDVADKLGISRQAISLWERGDTMPDIATLPDLARLLGTTTDAILSAGDDGFEGFDEIINRVNLVKAKTQDIRKEREVYALLDAALKQINEILNESEERGQ